MRWYRIEGSAPDEAGRGIPWSPHPVAQTQWRSALGWPGHSARSWNCASSCPRTAGVARLADRRLRRPPHRAGTEVAGRSRGAERRRGAQSRELHRVVRRRVDSGGRTAGGGRRRRRRLRRRIGWTVLAGFGRQRAAALVTGAGGGGAARRPSHRRRPCPRGDVCDRRAPRRRSVAAHRGSVQQGRGHTAAVGVARCSRSDVRVTCAATRTPYASGRSNTRRRPWKLRKVLCPRRFRSHPPSSTGRRSRMRSASSTGVTAT